MSCYHPLKAFPVGLTKDNKTQYKITSYKTHHVELINNNWIPVDISNISSYATKSVLDFVEIPCGKCIGCRMDYSRQWADRMMLELQQHDSAYFLTLTYDDIHVPRSVYADPETGEAHTSLTLRKRDFQLFMKRLRKHFPDDKLRFFACTEYGGQTFRPHYHVIVFGLHLNDLVLYKRSKLGYNYYNSKSVQDCWSIRTDFGLEPLGYVVVADVTWETCAYTARYVTKKVTGDDAQIAYDDLGLERPCSLMSRKPGIGSDYIHAHADDFRRYTHVDIPTGDGSRPIYPNRYIDNIVYQDSPELLADLKERRRKYAEAKADLKMERTSLLYEEMLEVEEEAFLSRISSLKRDIV